MIKLWKVIVAIYHREPLGHISDLWAEFRGTAVLCGKPPYQYLLVFDKKAKRR
jgi:hypothetical protein